MVVEVYNMRGEDFMGSEISRRASSFLLEVDLASPDIIIDEGGVAIPIQLRLRPVQASNLAALSSVAALRPSLLEGDESTLRLLFLRLLRRRVEGRLHEVENLDAQSPRLAEIRNELQGMKGYLNSLTWPEVRVDVDRLLDLLDIGVSKLMDSNEATIIEVVKIDD